MYLCYGEPAPGYINKLISASLSIVTSATASPTAPPLVFTSPPPAALVLASLRRSCFSWKSNAQSTAAVPAPPCSCPPRGPQLFLGGVQTTAQECAHQRTVSVVATFCWPSSSTSQHFGCSSHLTTQNVLSKCTPKNVLSKCTVYSCTHLVHHSYSCIHLVHHSFSCTILVHHSFSCTTPHSCTAL